MTNCKDLLTKELSVLYPDFTDEELNEATINLRDFYTLVIKVVLENQENTQEAVLEKQS